MFWTKKTFLPGFLRITFSPVFSGVIFHRNVVLERSQNFFFLLSQDFLEEFLWDRNSCIYPGILRGIPEDSEGFLFPPKAVDSGQRLKKALC
jgi:hypothetical protein